MLLGRVHALIKERFYEVLYCSAEKTNVHIKRLNNPGFESQLGQSLFVRRWHVLPVYVGKLGVVPCRQWMVKNELRLPNIIHNPHYLKLQRFGPSLSDETWMSKWCRLLMRDDVYVNTSLRLLNTRQQSWPRSTRRKSARKKNTDWVRREKGRERMWQCV